MPFYNQLNLRQQSKAILTAINIYKYKDWTSPSLLWQLLDIPILNKLSENDHILCY